MDFEICEECLEFTCEYKYPELCLDCEDCPICMDSMTIQTVCFLDGCRHRYHRECIETASRYHDVANEKTTCTYKCPYCSKISKNLISYDEYHIRLSNRILPAIGTVPSFVYVKLYNENKFRLRPTEKMKEYVKNVSELYSTIGIDRLNQYENSLDYLELIRSYRF